MDSPARRRNAKMLVAMTCAVGAANANDAARPPLIASPKEGLKQLHEISGGSLSRFQAEEGYFRMLAGLLTGAALVCDPAGSPEAFAECYDFFRLGIGAPTMKMKRSAQCFPTHFPHSRWHSRPSLYLPPVSLISCLASPALHPHP